MADLARPRVENENQVWDIPSLDWVPMRQPIIEAGSVTIAGSLTANPSFPATNSVTSVAASATNVTLLSSSATRKGAYFFNDADKYCYLKLGTTATTASYTIKMAAGSFYEIPYPCYTGRIDGIWEAAPTGSMRITELTA